MPVASIHVKGMPYVPGVAQGILHHGAVGIVRRSVLVISQDEIPSLNTLPAAIVVVNGAPLSHTMIRLLGYGIPTVIVSKNALSDLQEGTEVWIDGNAGLISNQEKPSLSAISETSASTPGQPVMTKDGTAVLLRASVRSFAAARKAMAAGVESIGLVRSEFFMPEDGSVPDVHYYKNAFAQLCEIVKPLPVTIRLLDVAPDKMLHGLLPDNIVGGVLGLQGARLYEIEPVRSMLDAQLEAINILSEQYPIRILIPYLVTREELQYWVKYINGALSRPVSIGAMAETPASTLDFHNWLDIADFVAIGCNDLMQCLYAADRDRPELRRYLDPYAPLLFRFLKTILPSTLEQSHKIQVCGVLSQLPGVLPILLGLGYRVFSIDAALVPYLVQTIQSTRIKDAEQLAQKVCAASETRQVLELSSLQKHPAKTDIKTPAN